MSNLNLGLILDVLKVIGINRQQPEQQIDLNSILALLGQRQNTNDLTPILELLKPKNDFWKVGDKYAVDVDNEIVSGELKSLTDNELVINETLINRMRIATATKGK